MECEEYCHSCLSQGLYSKLVFCDINIKDSIGICENENCTNMVQSGEDKTSETPNVIVPKLSTEVIACSSNGNVESDLGDLISQLSNIQPSDELMTKCDVDFDSFFSGESDPVIAPNVDNNSQEVSIVEADVVEQQCPSTSSGKKMGKLSNKKKNIPTFKSTRLSEKANAQKKDNKVKLDLSAYDKLFNSLTNDVTPNLLKYSNRRLDLSFDATSTSTITPLKTCSLNAFPLSSPIDVSAQNTMTLQSTNIAASSTSDTCSVNGSRACSSSVKSFGSNDSGLGNELRMPAKQKKQKELVYVRSAYMDVIKAAIERESQRKMRRKSKVQVYTGLDLESLKKPLASNRGKHKKC